MTIKLQLPPEIEETLVAQAQARGLSLEAYLEQMLRELSRTATPPPATGAEKAAAFEAWAHSHPSTPALSDDAVKRQNLVRDAS